jgi:hypothetical protein
MPDVIMPDVTKADVTSKEKDEAAKKAHEQNVASVEGARSVADAVKRVADAAVMAAANVKAEPAPELIATGMPGGKLTIVGSGFSSSGTVLINGVAVATTGWGATRIEGRLPADAQSGEVVVWVDPQTQRRGYLTITA